ncbi:MAG: CRTAC1 family protein [bacterium]
MIRISTVEPSRRRLLRLFWICPLLAGLLCCCSRTPEADTLFRRADPGDLPTGGLTYGVTLLDGNGDGRRDLLFSRHGDRAEMYLNRGKLRFQRCAADSLLPGNLLDQHGTAACDFDHDGDWDAYVTLGAERGEGLSLNQLWEQTEPGRFTNIAAGNLTLNDPVGRGRGSLWADFNGDSLVDLLLISYQSQARLVCQGDNGWVDQTSWFPTPMDVPLWSPGMPPPTPAERARSTWIHAASATDIDGDGAVDLLAMGRGGWSGLWRNTGRGRFQDVTSIWGLRAAFWPQVPSFACVGDVDGDRDLDLILLYRLYQTDIRLARGQFELWLNERDNEGPYFRRAGAESGLSGGKLAEAGQLADLDNDGNLDLFVIQNDRLGEPVPNLVFLGDGQGRFHRLRQAWDDKSVPPGTAESGWATDLDRDGDLDLLLCNGGGTEPDQGGGVLLYENTSRSSRGITLELDSRTGPPHGLGARVELRCGGLVGLREVSSLATPFASTILPVHFGVGDLPGPYRVTIRWASGQVQEVELPRAGRAYLVREDDNSIQELP